METALKELDNLIEALEAHIPASPMRNENLARQLESDMKKYFRNLENALDWNAIERIYYKLVRE